MKLEDEQFVVFQRILHIEGAPSMFVTGLEFLPVASGGPPITSCTEVAVLSISVDNRVCIHSLPFRSKYSYRSSL
jgi:prolactin regulatory element-binding protein